MKYVKCAKPEPVEIETSTLAPRAYRFHSMFRVRSVLYFVHLEAKQ